MLQESKNSGTIYDLTSLRKIRPFSDCKDFKTLGLTKIRFSDCGQSKKKFSKSLQKDISSCQLSIATQSALLSKTGGILVGVRPVQGPLNGTL